MKGSGGIRRALFLINPRARKGRSDISLVRERLSRAGVVLVDAAPAPFETLSDVILKQADHVDCVVIGGGDGSLNDAAPALLKTRLPLGILPLGTANDFARTMGIPVNLQSASELIARGATLEVDIGLANDIPFFNVASIGFSAELAQTLTGDLKKRWGKLGYGIAAARMLRSARLMSMWLVHDGRTERFKTFQVSVGNGRFYGGGMSVHEQATAMDGLLDFYSLEVNHWWHLLRLLPSIRRGSHGNYDQVRSFSTRSLVIRMLQPQPVNLDGEVKTRTPVKFSILEKAVVVMAEKPYATLRTGAAISPG